MSIVGNSDKPRTEIVADGDTVGRRSAEIVAATVDANPDAVLAVPTGSTPLPMFAELVERVNRGSIDLSRVHLFTLDEYVGMHPDRPNSLSGWLIREFLDPAGIDPSCRHLIPATVDDLERAAAAYEAELASLGGLDLAVVGLGPNGHVAYNEPGADATSRTRVVQLTPDSIEQAAGYWPEEDPVPSQAITMGVATLLEARQIVLIVAGAGKSEILRRTLLDPPTESVPASWLRQAGDRLTVIADEAAARELPESIRAGR
jgi:glucosamine-6-phosphate deaminase